MSTQKHLFIFGFGYTASAMAKALLEQGWRISATSRHEPKRREMRRLGIEAYDFLDAEGIAPALQQATHLLSSISPIKQGDTVLKHYGENIASGDWQWIGYLSSTGVYGDHDGDWVDEDTPVKADKVSERNKERIVAERMWQALHTQHQQPVHLFRLSGIYGPGRGLLARLKRGMDRTVYKEGQYFSRTHVQDIARALQASIQQPEAGAIYNICDDLPAPSHEVVAFAAQALGVSPPPVVDWQEAEMSPMAREFYQSNRRVKCERIKAILPDNRWLYPSYKEGILADIRAIKGEAA